MSFETEMEAFKAYAEAMPNNCVFLVDTYETLEGVKCAIEIKFQDWFTALRQTDSSGFGGYESLEIDDVQKQCLKDLTLDNRPSHLAAPRPKAFARCAIAELPCVQHARMS